MTLYADLDVTPDLDAEVFLPIPGYEGLYEVSRNACVRSVARTVNLGYFYRGLKRIPSTDLRPFIREGRGHVALPSQDGAVPGEAKWKNQTKHCTLRLAYLAWVGPIPDGHCLVVVPDAGDLVDRAVPIPRSLLPGLNNRHERARERARKKLLERYAMRAPARRP